MFTQYIHTVLYIFLQISINKMSKSTPLARISLATSSHITRETHLKVMDFINAFDLELIDLFERNKHLRPDV